MGKVINVKNSILKCGSHYLTSDYRSRNKKRPLHKGMDFVARKNNYNTTDDIIAIADGIVESTGYGVSSGYYVKIKHSNGLISLYYHLKKNTTKVKKGQKIVKGQTLGYMGSTGNSTGAHLHFGVYNPSDKTYLDPLPYLEGTKSFDKKKIVEDGIWGKGTTTRAQEVFGTTIDGEISNQNIKYKYGNPGLSSSTFEWKTKPKKSGSKLIKAIQKKVGVKQTGQIDDDTIAGMQKWLGTTIDRKVSKPSQMVKAFQKWLNAQ